jgi:DNA excision repair protein ERCC-6
LTQAQLTLYEKYLTDCREFLDSDYNRPEALGILNNLRKICNHPFMYFAYHDSDKATGFKMRKIETSYTYSLYRETRLGAEKEFEDKRLIEATAACRHWQLSGKLRVLVSFLEDWREKDPTTKVLVFSQTKKILDILERLCLEHAFRFLRMDGNVSLKERIDLIRRFNQEPEHYLFLLTTRVGGLGINLTAANKVVIFDPDWNPMVDIQATDRALRIG